MTTPRANGRRSYVVGALTAAHIEFIQRFMIRNNAERAYQDSHPKASWATCRTEGAKLLKDPRIASQLSALRREKHKRLAHKGEDIVRELAALGFSNVADLYTKDGTIIAPMDMPREIGAAVKKVKRTEILGTLDKETGKRQVLGHTIEVELHDKVGPLKLLGQRLGVLEPETRPGADNDLAALIAAAGQRVIDLQRARLAEQTIEGERID
jgi:phage terminase small subunit